MSDTIEITATIKNATFHGNGDKQYVRGNIYDDKECRWPDGTSICTSAIRDVTGDIVITRNSTYRIERSARI
jgi:hypothetical protein